MRFGTAGDTFDILSKSKTYKLVLLRHNLTPIVDTQLSLFKSKEYATKCHQSIPRAVFLDTIQREKTCAKYKLLHLSKIILNQLEIRSYTSLFPATVLNIA